MKKGKLNLRDLAVKSFVTTDNKSELETVKGGRAAGTHYSFCSFTPCDCPDTITVDVLTPKPLR